MKISLVVPTLNAGCFIEPLLTRVKEQTIPVNEIVIVDSDSDDDTVDKAKKFDGVKIISIERKDFNHGICPHCGQPLRCFDKDSQGGHLWTCDNCGYYTATSWIKHKILK